MVSHPPSEEEGFRLSTTHAWLRASGRYGKPHSGFDTQAEAWDVYMDSMSAIGGIMPWMLTEGVRCKHCHLCLQQLESMSDGQDMLVLALRAI